MEVERHHLVPDELVDDRLGEQRLLGAPVEAAEDAGDVLGVGVLGRAGEPPQIGEQHPGEHLGAAGWRQLDAHRAHVGVLPRRAEPEGAGGEPSHPRERGGAHLAPWVRRKGPPHPMGEAVGQGVLELPQDSPVLGGQRLAVGAARRLAQPAQSRPLDKAEPLGRDGILAVVVGHATTLRRRVERRPEGQWVTGVVIMATNMSTRLSTQRCVVEGAGGRPGPGRGPGRRRPGRRRRCR